MYVFAVTRYLRCPLWLWDTRLDILNLLRPKAGHGALVFGTGHAWRTDGVQVGNWGLPSSQSFAIAYIIVPMGVILSPSLPTCSAFAPERDRLLSLLP